MRVRKIVKSDYWLHHVCPSVRMEQLVSHWTNFHEGSYFSSFRKNCRDASSFIQIGQE